MSDISQEVTSEQQLLGSWQVTGTEYAHRLTEYDEKGRLTTIGFAPNFGNSWLYMFGWMNDARFMSPDGKTAMLNEPAVVQALDYMKLIYDDAGGYEAVQAFQAGFQSGSLDPFIQGKVAMKIDGVWTPLDATLGKGGTGPAHIKVADAALDEEHAETIAEPESSGPSRQLDASELSARITEAPSYRRVALERMRAEGMTGDAIKRSGTSRGFGIRDGHGIVFVSNTGDICPAGFLPLVTGNVRRDRIADVYRNAPLFQSLHDPSQFEGRCGFCEYSALCGGSRARAYAATGDPLASDPLCDYEPPPRSERP